MSNLLAQYANNITAQASQVGSAHQMEASTHAQASQNTAQAITGLKQTLQAQEQTKLQAQQIQAQREAAALQADGQNSFMRMLAAKDSGASDTQAMAMENARQEKLRKDLQASANIPQTGLEITAAATAVAGKKVGDFGKWAWSHTFGEKAKARKADKQNTKQAIQTASQNVMQDFYKTNPQLNTFKPPTPPANKDIRIGTPNIMPISQSPLTK